MQIDGCNANHTKRISRQKAPGVSLGMGAHLRVSSERPRQPHSPSSPAGRSLVSSSLLFSEATGSSYALTHLDPYHILTHSLALNMIFAFSPVWPTFPLLILPAALLRPTYGCASHRLSCFPVCTDWEGWQSLFSCPKKPLFYLVASPASCLRRAGGQRRGAWKPIRASGCFPNSSKGDCC